MALTDTAVRLKKAGAKPEKLFDERGLYLLVAPTGGKWWRLKYRFEGKEKLLSLGTYPDTPLSKAREKRDEARRLIAEGIDPSAHRQAVKAARTDANSFEAVAREWHTKFSPKWTEKHAARILRRLERDVFPWIGKRPVREVNAPDLLTTMRRIEARGAIETAHRALRDAGQVFRYAVATGRAERDPSGDLRGALPPVISNHHASITDPKEVGRAAPRHRAIRRLVHHEVCTQACATRVRASRRTAVRSVGRVRPGRARVANTRRAHEDEGAAHRSALEAGCGGPARATGAHGRIRLSLPERADVGAADERYDGQRGALGA